MRIAVVGSHGTGKSTLVAELARVSELAPVEEPYYQLLSAGHSFAEPPTIGDFEVLFDAAVTTFATHPTPGIIFDRSPADYLAYVAALQPRTDVSDRVTAAISALMTLDLVVYVPIERPDRLPHAELPRLRRGVDRILRDMFVEHNWGWTTPCVEVHGTVSQRADQVAQGLR